jgi:hypothetical protein
MDGDDETVARNLVQIEIFGIDELVEGRLVVGANAVADITAVDTSPARPAASSTVLANAAAVRQ